MVNDQPDPKYMLRCIDLARKGFRQTLSNPTVGCVIVHEHRIIGEGYHKKFGEQHAEIHAIESVTPQDKALLPYSTMYVTLEPCVHTGKTPPCAHRIVKEGIKNVVIGTSDPNPMISGKGIQYLKENGIMVNYPFLKDNCDDLISKFTSNLNGKPYVILKWAQSADNYIGLKGTQTWLSNEYTRVLTHKWRTESEAIMVGKNTAIIDNPVLNVRYYTGPSPVRILMDSLLKTPANSKLLRDGLPTIIINTVFQKNEGNLSYVKVENMSDTSGLLKKLFDMGISSLLIEGGAALLKSFISSNNWNEARVIKTKTKLEDGIYAPAVQGLLIKEMDVAGDQILFIKNKFKNQEIESKS